MSSAGKPGRADRKEHDYSRPRTDSPHAAEGEPWGTPELLGAAEIRCRRLFDTSQNGIVLLDVETGVIIDVNAALLNLMGYSYKEIAGRTLWEIGPPAIRELAKQAFEKVRRDRYVRLVALPFETSDGRRIQVELVGNVYRVGNGEVIQCEIRDNSTRQPAEGTPGEGGCKMASLHKAAHELETCEDEEEVCRLAAEAARRTLGFPVCTLYTVDGDKLVARGAPSEDAARAGQEVPLEGCRGQLAAEMLCTVKAHHSGISEEAPASCLPNRALQSRINVLVGHLGVIQVCSPLRGAFGEEDVRLLELLAEYTAEALKRIQLQKCLREQAIHDPLTGLYNRRFFTMVIAQEVSRSKRHGRPIGLLILDVNRFKQINDQLGHVVGDKVLREVGMLLRGAVRGEDFVVRYGGDEFLLVLPEMSGNTDVVKRRISALLDRWNAANSGSLPFPLGLAMGDAVWLPQSGQSIEVVLAEADRRMYECVPRLPNGPGCRGDSVPRKIASWKREPLPVRPRLRIQ